MYIHLFSYSLFLWDGSSRRLEITHGFQQSQTVLLAPHQDGAPGVARCTRYASREENGDSAETYSGRLEIHAS